MGANLPSAKIDDQTLSLLLTRWKSSLDPIITNPLLNGQIVANVQLSPGINAIPHKLGRVQQGYFFIYNNWILGNPVVCQPLNDKFLYLQGSSSALVSLWCF